MLRDEATLLDLVDAARLRPTITVRITTPLKLLSLPEQCELLVTDGICCCFHEISLPT